MSVVSTTAGHATRPDQRRRLRSSLNRAYVPGLIAAVVATTEVVLRVVLKLNGHVGGMPIVGDVYGHPGHVPAGVTVFPYGGYDGQFYSRMALAPASLQRTMFGISIDSAYRFVRIGYPALAWLLSAGQHAAVPYVLAVTSGLGRAAIPALGGIFAKEAGRHALWGLLLASSFGFATSLTRDLTEPLAA